MREEINKFVVTRTRGRVQGGPFRGMQILPESCWGDGDITPKLLGLYEQELHDVFGAVGDGDYGAIVNIGSAEGYYAIGLARLCPGLPVYAFDLNAQAPVLQQKNAALNGVADRVVSRGGCGPAELVALAEQHGRLFVLCDCEGYEMTLFSNLDVIIALQGSDIVVECHDFMDPRCTPLVFGNLWQTHRIDVVYGGGRDPGAIPMLSRYSDIERWIAVCENRPKLMNWLVCRSK